MVALSKYRNTKEIKRYQETVVVVRIECRGVIDSVYGCDNVDDVPDVAMSPELSTYVPERTANQPQLPVTHYLPQLPLFMPS